MRIKNLFSGLIRNEEGTVLPFVAMTFPIILGFVGLGTDASLWMAHKRSLQTAADAAVISAGWEIAQESEQYMDYAALKEAQNNGYEPDANGVMSLEIIEDSGDTITVSVTLAQDAETLFSSIIFNDPVRISANAQALVSGVDGQFCILALEEEDAGAVTTHGNVEVNAPDCGIAVNSADDEALSMSGSVDVTVSTVRITGDYNIGGSVNFVYDSLRTGMAPLTDPYEDLEVPEHEDCDYNNMRVNSSSTLRPGVYCGGLDLSGSNNIQFEPGVYIIKDGNFKVTGSGSIVGDGVSFVLTGDRSYAQLDISGSRQIEFSAPAEGDDMEGVVFFQDRNAPTRSSLQNKLVGTSDITINGVAYFPSQGLWFGGDSTLAGGDSPCTKLIARTITLSGNPRLGNSCEDVAVRDTGMPNVRLIN